jgi:GDP-4-dehydro-6-deoxy-D-mannose reductase
VVHLAAVASVSLAGRDVPETWSVNALGTVRLAEQLARRGGNPKPVLLFVSTAEVYGRGPEVPRLESDPTNPVSAYAASKLAGEIAVLEIHRRTGLPVIVTRSFGHTGPGQAATYVVPAFAGRLLLAKRVGAPVVEVGNLEPVREFLHVQDVVEAYRLLLEGGEPGQIYNVASGTGVSLRDVFLRLAEAADHRAVPETDASLVRPVDIPYLVGNGAKIEAAVGWKPTISWEQTLAEVIDAQAN